MQSEKGQSLTINNTIMCKKNQLNNMHERKITEDTNRKSWSRPTVNQSINQSIDQR